MWRREHGHPQGLFKIIVLQSNSEMELNHSLHGNRRVTLRPAVAENSSRRLQACCSIWPCLSQATLLMSTSMSFSLLDFILRRLSSSFFHSVSVCRPVSRTVLKKEAIPFGFFQTPHRIQWELSCTAEEFVFVRPKASANFSITFLRCGFLLVLNAA